MRNEMILAAGLFATVAAGAQGHTCPVTVKVPGYAIKGIMTNLPCAEANALTKRALPLPPGQSPEGWSCTQPGTGVRNGAVLCQSTDGTKKAIAISWDLPK